jgi:hypothetical protein
VTPVSCWDAFSASKLTPKQLQSSIIIRSLNIGRILSLRSRNIFFLVRGYVFLYERPRGSGVGEYVFGGPLKTVVPTPLKKRGPVAPRIYKKMRDELSMRGGSGMAIPGSKV